MSCWSNSNTTQRQRGTKMRRARGAKCPDPPPGVMRSIAYQVYGPSTRTQAGQRSRTNAKPGLETGGHQRVPEVAETGNVHTPRLNTSSGQQAPKFTDSDHKPKQSLTTCSGQRAPKLQIRAKNQNQDLKRAAVNGHQNCR